MNASAQSDILLVEDDPAFFRLAKTVLEKDGHGVRACTMAKEALQLCRQRRPDLALLDIGLPDGNGFDLCRSIRSQAPELPVIFLTARGDIRSRLNAFEAGCQDYLQKPFAFAELAARVRVHLRTMRRSEELARKNMELELRERVRRDTTDMIVHDLKAPLSAIMGTLQLIKEQGMIASGMYDRLIGISETASGMMLLMINDILDVAQAEQTGLRAELAPMQVAKLVQKVGAMFEPICMRRGLGYTAQARGDGTIRTDQQLVFRVLANLLNNAVKFTKEGGEVRLDCELRPDAAVFAVLDNGPGVPDKDKERIFQKFVRLGEQRPIEHGSGIGLSFCRVASDALGGRIWVEDRPGGGSRFVLQLPRSELIE